MRESTMGEHELQQNQNKKRNLSPLSNSNSKKTRMQIVPDTGSSEIEAELKKKKLKVPLMNTRVERNKVRKAGEYILGPEITSGPVDCISHYLARKECTNEFYKLKILTLDYNNNSPDTPVNPKHADRPSKEVQGKMLIHTEYNLLSMLQDLEGVVKCKTIFKELALEERVIESKNASNISVYTGKVKKRIVLVLDNYEPNEFCEESYAYCNLQSYVTKNKLSEKAALNIFFEIIKIVENLHERNIIHRDLKLNNLVLNVRTKAITLTNFCLGKCLINENDNLYDQRGSPAYISPDVLATLPYKGKPSDMWALGVVLYTLIYSHFPFIETTTSGLFKKIRQCDYVFPADVRICDSTKKIIKSLLNLDPNERATATETRLNLEKLRNKYQSMRLASTSAVGFDDQIVPQFNESPTIDQSKVSFLNDTPRFEPSSDPLSFILEVLSTAPPRESKSFLKPSTLSQQNQGVQIVEVDEPANEAQSNLSRSNSNVGITRNLTRQINNLSVRNRINNVLRLNMSWHNRISTISSIYEARMRDFANNGTNFINQRSSAMQHLRDLQNQLAMRRLNPNQSIAPAFVSQVQPHHMPSMGVDPADSQAVIHIFNTMNEMFNNGMLPAAGPTLVPFTGIITSDLANKLSQWLRVYLTQNELIREIFESSNECLNVQEFLRRCGVKMEVVNGEMQVKKAQTSQLILLMTYVLQISGYSNSFFMTNRP